MALAGMNHWTGGVCLPKQHQWLKEQGKSIVFLASEDDARMQFSISKWQFTPQGNNSFLF